MSSNVDTSYSCAVFGPLKIPYYSLVEGPENPYKEDDVEIVVIPKKFEIPDPEVRKFMKENVKKREEQARKEGKVFYDGPMVRLSNYVVNDEDHKLTLYEQPTSFFTRVFTKSTKL